MPKGQLGRAICTIEGCVGFVDGHGLCHTHAERKRRTGHPLGTTKVPGRARFWTKVDQSAGPDACWTWLGGTGRSGYGVFYGDGRRYKAHRFAYSISHGEIPDGMYVCHRCDNPRCVNPAHLFVGTQLDNMRDMVAKGRSLSGRPRAPRALR